MLHPPFRTVQRLCELSEAISVRLAPPTDRRHRNTLRFIEEVANLRAPGVSRLAVDIIYPYDPLMRLGRCSNP